MYYTLGLLLAVSGAPPASLSCQRPFASGPFPAATEVICQVLRPHLQQALSLHHQMGALHLVNAGLETALEMHEHAVPGLDNTGRIVFCNRLAMAVARGDDSIRIAKDRLSCCDSGSDVRLQSLLRKMVSASLGLASGTGDAVLVPRKSPKQPLRITATPFHSSLPGRTTRLAALVFLTDPSSSLRSRSTLMTSLYALTPTEARVADLLLQGLDPDEIANRLRMAKETFRFHVKRILSKTGARKQSELIRLMLTLPSG